MEIINLRAADSNSTATTYMVLCSGTTLECVLSQTKMAVSSFAQSPVRQSYWCLSQAAHVQNISAKTYAGPDMLKHQLLDTPAFRHSQPLHHRVGMYDGGDCTQVGKFSACQLQVVTFIQLHTHICNHAHTHTHKILFNYYLSCLLINLARLSLLWTREYCR